MKDMKRILIIAVLAVVSVAAHAQFRWSAVAGANYTNLNFKQDIVSVTKGVGYGAGIVGEMMFPGIGFGLDFGLMYEQESAKVNLGEKTIWASEGYGKETAMLHNIHIPVHLRFKYTRLNGFEEKLAPLVYFGPEFNIQAAHGGCKAFKYSGGDLSLAVGVGAEIFRRWQVIAGYTWGMTYVLKTQLLEDFSAKASGWTLRVAYFF